MSELPQFQSQRKRGGAIKYDSASPGLAVGMEGRRSQHGPAPNVGSTGNQILSKQNQRLPVAFLILIYVAMN